MARHLWLLVCCAFCASRAFVTPAAAAPPPELAAPLAAIEKAVEAKRQELHVPGASLVIVKDDRVIYRRGLGLRDVEGNFAVSPETLFAIGSSSKAFTAMTVLMAAEEGKLSLQDPPRKYLPYFKLQDPEADAKITVGDLLSHRSGLDRTDMLWYPGLLSSRQVIQAMADVKGTAKLGEKFQYQNVMFLAAGEIVGSVEGGPWSDVVARRIFRPLGMRSTGTSIREMQRQPDHALGYVYDAARKDYVRVPMRDISRVAPAGAINSNADDMAQWLRLMLGGGAVDGRRLLSEKSFRELTVERIPAGRGVAYGYGWFLRNWNGHRVVEHGGNIDGFNAQVALMPDQKLGFALLTNVSASPLGALTMEIVWKNLVGEPNKPVEAPTVAGTSPQPAGDPRGEVGVYRLPEANLTMRVTLLDGKLQVQVTGQPGVPLENMGGRRYRVLPPAPEGSFVTFRPAAGDPVLTELFLQQPGGIAVVLKKETETAAPAFQAPMTGDELVRKVIEAAGGETALRKHRSVVIRSRVEVASQGLSGRSVSYARAPNAASEVVSLYAAGRKVIEIREYFDGLRGGTRTSFGQRAEKTGKDLADAALASDFYGELNWPRVYRTATIKRMEKVGDEEAYVAELVPEKGSPLTAFISTRSFRILKRTSTVEESLSDYRPVDGVMIPFRREAAMPGLGRVVQTVEKVEWDVKIPAEVFAPRK